MLWRMNYYKRHVGDYIKDAAHLTLLEHGVYSRLLDVYYAREGPIPDTDAARLIGARTNAERAALRGVLAEFFSLSQGSWHQNRCDIEIEKAVGLAERSREVGKKGGRPRKTETQQVTENNPTGLETGTPGDTKNNPSHKPLANNHKPVVQNLDAAQALLADIEPQIAADWQALRKQKKAPVTATAVDRIRAEAIKAGLTLQDALAVCCQRGWTGFEAEWVLKDQRSNGSNGASKQESLEARNRATAQAWTPPELRNERPI